MPGAEGPLPRRPPARRSDADCSKRSIRSRLPTSVYTPRPVASPRASSTSSPSACASRGVWFVLRPDRLTPPPSRSVTHNAPARTTATTAATATTTERHETYRPRDLAGDCMPGHQHGKTRAFAENLSSSQRREKDKTTKAPRRPVPVLADFSWTLRFSAS